MEYGAVPSHGPGHELTHWADAEDGVDDEPYEEGDQYGKDVYGRFAR